MKVKILSVPMGDGGKVKPPTQATAQDSLDVYNNAKKVRDFYENSGKYSTTGAWEYPISDFDRENSEAYTRYIQEGAEHMTPSGKRKLNNEDYRKYIDNNKYYQRERESKTLNMDAPMSLYDRRIIPQKSTLLNYNNKPNDPLNNDLVNLYQYDPIAVKPYKLLTSDEKKIRDKKYPQPIVPSVPISQSGTGDYKAVELYPEHHIYNYPTQQQADSAATSIGNKTYQQGGQVMKQCVRIISAPEMKYGGNRSGSYNQLDTSWNTGTYAGAPGVMPDPDPYAKVGRTLPDADPHNADLTWEKNEVMLTNVGGQPSTFVANTGTHASGNDQSVTIPGEDKQAFIFSDTKDLKIKNPEILKLFNETKGKTPAGIAKKYNLSKYTKVIADPDTDNVSKKTAQMMVDNMTGKLNLLANIQEAHKASKGIEDNSAPQQMQPPMQAYGGYMDYGGETRYPDGGGVKDTTYIDDPRYRQYQSNAYGFNQQNTPPPAPPTSFYQQYNQPAQHSGNQVKRARVTPPVGKPIPHTQIDPMTIPNTDTPVVPQPTNMQAIGDLGGVNSDNMASFTPTFNKDSFTDDDKNFNAPFGTPTPNKLGIADSVMNLASIHRYQPWEAPINAVLPQTTYMDPTRALAANSEAANSLSYNNALSGNSRAARASNMALQGEAGKSAADIVGNYANQNTQIANRSSEQATEIMNRLQEMQAARSNRLYQGNVTAAQQYDNATRQGRNDLTKQLQEAWKDRQAYDDLNQTNQFYYRDPKSGRITFRPGMDRVTYNQITSGRGAGNYNSPEQIAEYYRSHGITDPKMIADVQDDWIREHQLDLRNRTKTTTKSGNTTTQSTSYNKFGGYTNKLKKFTAK